MPDISCTMLRNVMRASLVLVGLSLMFAEGTFVSVHAAGPGSTRELLTPAQWKRLDDSVDAGLNFLSTKQQPSGAFETLELGQPGVTSLCILAYLSRGHLPHEGQYGPLLDRAIDYVLHTQHSSGLLFALPFNGKEYGDRRHKTGAYNHAIAGVMLAEIYGMTQGKQRETIGDAIDKAIKFSLDQQKRVKPVPDEKGGWRYLTFSANGDSDLSVTAWEVMFFRAARNAGFDIPVESIDAAMDYVHRVYVPETGTFAYGVQSMRHQQTRAMAGSGILLLSLGGEHDTDMARSAGKWILNHQFDRYQRVIYGAEHYHYGAYYCSQAMFQLGGDYWQRFYPPFMEVHVKSQQPNGGWPRETNRDGEYGDVLSTSLMTLSLTPPYQLLPIYQR